MADSLFIKRVEVGLGAILVILKDEPGDICVILGNIASPLGKRKESPQRVCLMMGRSGE
jgi:hypothetical protein